MKHHVKSIPIFEQSSMTISDSLIENVVIVNEGDDKNGGHFTKGFLLELVEAGNAQQKGVKSRFGHPNMCKSSLGDYIGRYKNFRYKEGSVFADLHLADITKATQVEGRGITMYDYITKMAAEEADMFGNSIHFTADYDYKEEEGKPVREVYKDLQSFIASDLVDSPAATTSLFKDTDDLGVIVSNFLDNNPDIFKAIEQDPTIIKSFFNKYNVHKSKGNEMKSIYKQVAELFQGKTKDINLTLSDGEIATFITDGSEIEVGDPVQDADGRPLEDGSYNLQNGTSFTVEAGKVATITEKEEMNIQEEIEKSLEPYKKSIDTLSKEADTLKELLEAQKSEFEKALKNQENAFEEKLKSLEGADYIPPTPDAPSRDGGDGVSSLIDSVKEFENNKK